MSKPQSWFPNPHWLRKKEGIPEQSPAPATLCLSEMASSSFHPHPGPGRPVSLPPFPLPAPGPLWGEEGVDSQRDGLGVGVGS